MKIFSCPGFRDEKSILGTLIKILQNARNSKLYNIYPSGFFHENSGRCFAVPLSTLSKKKQALKY